MKYFKLEANCIIQAETPMELCNKIIEQFAYLKKVFGDGSLDDEEEPTIIHRGEIKFYPVEKEEENEGFYFGPIPHEEE